MANPLSVIVGLLMVFFIPGYVLVVALFPRKDSLDNEYDLLYKITMGLIMSITLVIILSFAINQLGVNEDTGKGYFNATNLWLVLGTFSLIFFAIGWFRGGYPLMGKISPKLYREAPAANDKVQPLLITEKKARGELRRLALERQKLRHDQKEYEKRMESASKSRRKYYETQRDEAKDRLREIDRRMRQIEVGYEDELY